MSNALIVVNNYACIEVIYAIHDLYLALQLHSTCKGPENTAENIGSNGKHLEREI